MYCEREIPRNTSEIMLYSISEFVKRNNDAGKIPESFQHP